MNRFFPLGNFGLFPFIDYFVSDLPECLANSDEMLGEETRPGFLEYIQKNYFQIHAQGISPKIMFYEEDQLDNLFDLATSSLTMKVKFYPNMDHKPAFKCFTFIFGKTNKEVIERINDRMMITKMKNTGISCNCASHVFCYYNDYVYKKTLRASSHDYINWRPRELKYFSLSAEKKDKTYQPIKHLDTEYYDGKLFYRVQTKKILKIGKKDTQNDFIFEPHMYDWVQCTNIFLKIVTIFENHEYYVKFN
jgi:hypothetical protein